jgi:hypothetical protein
MDSGAWRPGVGQRAQMLGRMGSAARCDVLEHFPEEHGATGRVADERVRPVIPGHAYLVELDRPHPRVTTAAGPLELVARHYAADEVEPIL